ncbi:MULTISPECIES: MerR family transcriptional regulator [unclassified Microbacterium]|uniref:MerR family transcriptional regulator n=1 Tax=unclassified Microbacterium TaxID=2609290 RepID=UPI002469291A|nr:MULTISPECIES: MerR family transcriptional regulator [unclassified Microbacterium]MDH5131685.1 MerR family transcriptional regulator [Microbacterium sp. RD10]MDH5138374.1 MerR family transcriptional regulator [Microbacterium sp. RD11]MDH5144178.1 MerR family transcriptional regulator [Microbacterium sp. RD12]MDH5153795.1 MerR family transcriptional regulator [Microbacterium sp. RD06]MDH5167602.1 MerR family transcriptional regulator [Microbacterium sp. RD02]
MESRDWSIQEIARLAGTTSRTLRHYDDIGLLPPSRIAANGYRHYDAAALVRLQRILLLRELGLGLPQIAEVLGPSTGSGTQGSGTRDAGSGTRDSGSAAEASALETHLALLREEQTRLARQIASVESTITALRGGENLMAENMFDGFDHTQYKQEVEDRWGTKAYADSDRWWRGMSDAERADWQQRVSDLGRDWIAAAESGIDPASAEAQELARRHVAWLTGIPGAPAAALRKGPDAAAKAYVIGLGEMYVADPRFGANYATSAGGTQGAEFVRDALRIYADAAL